MCQLDKPIYKQETFIIDGQPHNVAIRINQDGSATWFLDGVMA